MKLKYIIASLIAGVAMLTACEKEADITLSEVKVDTSFVGFPKEGGSKVVTVTTTADWKVTVSEDDAAWLTVSPLSGSAGTSTINLTAAASDEGYKSSIVIECNGKKQIVNVSKEAGEKKEPEITPINKVIEAGAGTFRVKGLVTKVTNTEYGNFYVEDETGEIYIYGVKDAKGYPKDDASGWARFGIDAGDIVVVEGPFKLYNDTPELVDAAVISVEKSLISIEAFTFSKLPAQDTTFKMKVTAKESPLLVTTNAEWLQVTGVDPDGSYILEAAENIYSAERTADITVKGPTALKVVSVTQKGVPATGASISEIIAMADDSQVETLASSVVVALTTKGAVLSDGAKAVYVYGADAAALSIGDGVRVKGKKTTYNAVPEITDLTEVFVDSEGNKFDYPTATDITSIAGTYSATEAEYIKLTGTLSISGDGKYYLALDEFTDGSKVGSIVYPVESVEAAKFDGKKITVTGYFNGLSSKGKYINIIATKIVEFAENPKGSLTNPYTASEIATLLVGGSTFDEDIYIKGKISCIRYTFSASYGTANFWISDDGTAYGVSDDKKSTTEPTKDFLAYSIKWLGNTGWTEGSTQVEIGDEVIICGKVTLYNGLAETQSGKAWIYSLNGVTE